MPATTIAKEAMETSKAKVLLTLPVLNSDWSGDAEDIKIYRPICPPTMKAIEPVGLGYMHHVKRLLNSMTLSEDEDIEIALEGTGETEITDFDRDVYEESVPAHVLKYDPLKWREHDHYLIIGLGKMRYKATDDHIKQAYRRRVLKHHPDKLAGETETGANGAKQRKDNDSFFKCIQKSWEILTDPVKRRQFDSADPTFDETVPSVSSSKKSMSWEEFLGSFGQALNANARFSKLQPVPFIGDENSSKEDVEKFFDFWYTLDSWRTFEWYDEEEGGASDSRDDKRYIDKKNRAMRQKRKKEDNQRIIRLVDAAMKYDPRLQRFKELEREAREKKKRDKQMQEEAKEMERKQALEEQQKLQEAAALAVKQAQDEEKSKAKASKEAIRKTKRNIRREMQSFQYYLSEDADKAPSFSEIDERLLLVEKIFSALTELFEFEYMHAALNDLKCVPEKNALFLAIAEEAASKPSGTSLQLPEKYAHLKTKTPVVKTPTTQTPVPTESQQTASVSAKAPATDKNAWTPQQQSQLEAALRKYPASSFKSKPQSRWDKIAAAVQGKSVTEVKHRVKELSEQAMNKPNSAKKK